MGKTEISFKTAIQLLLIFLLGYFAIDSSQKILNLIVLLFDSLLKIIGLELMIRAKLMLAFSVLTPLLIIVFSFFVLLRKLPKSDGIEKNFRIDIPIHYFWIVALITIVSTILSGIFGLYNLMGIPDYFEKLNGPELNRVMGDVRLIQMWGAILSIIERISLFILFIVLILKHTTTRKHIFSKH